MNVCTELELIEKDEDFMKYVVTDDGFLIYEYHAETHATFPKSKNVQI